MPMAYDVGAIGVAATTTTAMVGSLLTSATAAKPSCFITGLWANAGGQTQTTVGGGYLSGNTWQTVGTQTTTTTPKPKNTFFPAASTGAVNAAANGAVGTGTQSQRITVGYAQVGPGNFWVASTPDMALQLAPGASTAGYADLVSRTATGTQLLNWNIEFTEQ